MRTVGATQGLGSSTVARILEFPVRVAGNGSVTTLRLTTLLPFLGRATHGGTEGRLVVDAPQFRRHLLIVGENQPSNSNGQVTVRVQPTLGGCDGPRQFVSRKPAKGESVAHEWPIDAVHGMEGEQRMSLFAPLLVWAARRPKLPNQ